MATVEWRHKFPKALVLHELVLGSDHCPLIVNLNVPLNKVPKLFKFESMWSTHPNYKDVINSSWNCPTSGSCIFQFVQRQKSHRKHLTEWSKHEFVNNKIKIDLLKTRLASIQASPSMLHSDEEEREIKTKIETLLDSEEMYYHQRSRVNWLNYGDRNTAFFHATVIQRRRRNQLLAFKDDNGDWLNSEVEINQHRYTWIT